MDPPNAVQCTSDGFPASERRFAGLYCCLKIPRPLLHVIGAGLGMCSPLLCGVINSLPSVKHFEDEMCYMSARDYWIYVLCLPGLEVQELKAALGTPSLLAALPLAVRAARFKGLERVCMQAFPKTPSQAASQGFSPAQRECRAHSTCRDQALLISFPLPSSA